MIISNISQAKNKPKFVVLLTDTNNKYTIYKDVVKKCGLRKGDPITEGKLNEILFLDEFHRGKDTALRYFSYRQRSEYELRKKLESKKFKMKVVDSVISNLKGIGLINDREFAESFTRNTLKGKAIGRNLLKQRLFDKKIPKDIVLQIIEKSYSNINEKESALETAKKQLKKYRITKSKSDDKQNYIRLSSFLSRRGFSWEIISNVMKQVFKKDELPEE